MDPQIPQTPHNQDQPQIESPAATPQPTPTNGQDPGRGLAIAGIILAFFFSLVGLILSIIAKKKSSAAGFHNTIATVGIILNAIFLALGLLIIPFVLISLLAVGGIQDRANTTSSENSANKLLTLTEAYNAEHGFYPTSLYEMNARDTSSIKGNSYFEVSLSPITKETARKSVAGHIKDVLNLYGCKQFGNKIGYWDYKMNKVVYLYTVNDFDKDDCKIVDN